MTDKYSTAFHYWVAIIKKTKFFYYFNSFQSTHEGFNHVNSENVFKVCDEPHPLLIKEMLTHCANSDLDPAYKT